MSYLYEAYLYYSGHLNQINPTVAVHVIHAENKSLISNGQRQSISDPRLFKFLSMLRSRIIFKRLRIRFRLRDAASAPTLIPWLILYTVVKSCKKLYISIRLRSRLQQEKWWGSLLLNPLLRLRNTGFFLSNNSPLGLCLTA
jgi:hypothetical protein